DGFHGRRYPAPRVSCHPRPGLSRTGPSRKKPRRARVLAEEPAPKGKQMAPDRRQMKLGAFFHPTGHHIASWRHADAYAPAHVDFAHYKALAQTAERGKFDLLFLADSPAMRNWPPERQSRVATYIAGFEPIT